MDILPHIFVHHVSIFCVRFASFLIEHKHFEILLTKFCTKGRHANHNFRRHAATQIKLKVTFQRPKVCTPLKKSEEKSCAQSICAYGRNQGIFVCLCILFFIAHIQKKICNQQKNPKKRLPIFILHHHHHSLSLQAFHLHHIPHLQASPHHPLQEVRGLHPRLLCSHGLAALVLGLLGQRGPLALHRHQRRHQRQIFWHAWPK